MLKIIILLFILGTLLSINNVLVEIRLLLDKKKNKSPEDLILDAIKKRRKDII